MTHVRVAVYTLKPGTIAEVVRRAEAEMFPILRQFSGFIAYDLVKTGHDTAISISSWESKEQAEQANQRIGSWVKQNVADTVASVESHIGELAFSSRDYSPASDEGEPPFVAE